MKKKKENGNSARSYPLNILKSTILLVFHVLLHIMSFLDTFVLLNLP